MKRIFAMLLSFVMLISLIPTVLAEEIKIIGDEPDPQQEAIPIEDDLIDIIEPAEVQPANDSPIITVQPQSVTAATDSTVTFTVKADNADSYQWYYRKNENSNWFASSLSSAKTDTLKLKATSSVDGRQFYCKVTNANGSTDSNIVTLTVFVADGAPVITSQPQSVRAQVGSIVNFSVVADGAESYQWYCRHTASNGWYASFLSSANSPTLKLKATTSANGHQYYCKVTNSNGSISSDIVTLTVVDNLPVITVQPQSVTADEGTTVSFNVKAEDAESYQWYCRKRTSSSWYASSLSGAKTPTLKLKATVSVDGYQYYCKVTNSCGSRKTSTVTLTVANKRPVITAQPQSAAAPVGTTASFTVKATDAESYQWYCRKNANSSWYASSLSSAKTDTLMLKATTSVDGYQYRCKVTNKAGSTYSNAAKLTVITKPTITTQPVSQTVNEGATVKFTVEAENASSYQWQYRTSANGSWKNSGLSSAKTATLTVKATVSLDGYQYRCKVTNAAGSTYSDVATLTVNTKPVITVQPVSQTAKEDTTVTFTVEAENADSYQWQYRKSASGSWNNSSLSGATTATLMVTATGSVDGCQYRCKVTNAAGSTYSDVATLTVVDKKPAITVQPESVTAAVDTQVDFTVEADYAGTYEWYIRENANGVWTKSVFPGTDTSTLTVTVSEELNGYQFYCKVTNACGFTASQTATLTIPAKAVIITNPSSVTVTEGEDATFTVAAQGENLRYQWYYRSSAEDSWTASKGAGNRTDTLTVTGLRLRNGFQYYCVIQNGGGKTSSEAATLTVLPNLAHTVITRQPLSYIASEGAALTLSVEVNPSADSYRWLYRSAADADWQEYGEADNTKSTLSVLAALSKNGWEFCCELSVDGQTVRTDAASLTVSGDKCGDNACWSLDSEGFLLVTGTGVMSGMPWSEYRDQIVRAVIQDGITTVDGFDGCSSLKSIVLPDSVTAIAELAFCESGIEEISIPDSVTSIGTAAFSMTKLKTLSLTANVTDFGWIGVFACNPDLTSVIIDGPSYIGENMFTECPSLTEVTIGDSVTHIDEGAFSDCPALTGISIPASVTSLGEGCFSKCHGLRSISVSESNPSFCSLDGVLFSKDTKTLVAYPEAKGSVYTVPDNVTTIRGGAFSWNETLTDLTVGSGPTGTQIYDALKGCSALVNLTVSEDNPDCMTQDNLLLSKDGARLYLCPYGSTGACTIPDSVTELSDCAFRDPINLTSLTVGKGLSIDQILSIISKASSLNSLSVSAENPYCMTVDDILYSKDSTELLLCLKSKAGEITLPEGVTRIADNAFSSCSNVSSVTIPNSVTAIGQSAFNGCSSLTSVTLGSGIASIGNSAFYSCSQLRDVYYRGSKSQWEEISIGSNNIPLINASRHYVGYDDSQVVDEGDFGTDNVFHWTVYGSGLLEISGQGSMPDFSNYGLPWNSYQRQITEAVISEDVTSIGNNAFYACSALTGVTIPDGVTEIGSSAFEGCSALTSVTIPDGVTSIGYSAFNGCCSLTEVNLPCSISSLGNAAFADCAGLINITVSDDNPVYCSADGVLFNKNMTSIITCPAGRNGYVIPDGVTSIGESAFSGCTALTSVTIPDSVTSIGESAFSGCTALTSVTIPDSVTSIGSFAFDGCSSLASITIPDKVTIINLYVFRDCSSLTGVTIGKGVTSINVFAFSSCSSLKSYSVRSENRNYSSKNGVLFNKDKTQLVKYPCGKSGAYTIPDSVTAIGGRAFEGCSGLTGVAIPDSVTAIGIYAFYGCSALTGVAIPDSVTSIGNYAFENCSSLVDMTIPGGVTQIGTETFCGCTGLTSVTIPDSVTSIGSYAFYSCSKLKDVFYKGTEEQWNAISIGSGNNPLQNATKHYNA